MATLRSDRRLYITADRSEVVEEGDTRAAFLLCGKGGLIRESEVARYGLSMQGGKVKLAKDEEVPAAKAKMAKAPENKMAAAPENKMAGEPEGKGEPEPWTMKMEPEEYLNRFPDGPNAEVARQHVSAEDAPAA